MIADPADSSVRRRYDAFDLVLPDGSRLTVDGVDDTTSVAELVHAASRVGARLVDEDVYVDGRRTDPRELLVNGGFRHGSRLRVGSGRATSFVPRVRATWVAGPDAGVSVELDVGVHIIGRASSAAVNCRDPELELHHASLTVRDDGAMTITQLAGANNVSVDGSPIEATVEVRIGQVVHIGASLLELGDVANEVIGQESTESSASHTRPTDPWRSLFVRTPRTLPLFNAVSLNVPENRPTTAPASGGLIPAVLGVVGAAGMAVVLHQVMFLLFGLMGALVAAGTWIAQRVSSVRGRRRSRRVHEQAVKTFTDALYAQQMRARMTHLASTPTIAAALATMHRRRSSLWSVRASDPDAFVVSFGIGDETWAPQVIASNGDAEPELQGVIRTASRLDRVPVPVTLLPGSVTALIGAGPIAAAVARAMVLQLSALSGPADWQLAVVADHRAEWECLSWLSHLSDRAGNPQLIAPTNVVDFTANVDLDDRRLLLVVVDRADLFAARTSPLRRLLASRRPVAVVLLCGSLREVPAIATRTLTIGPHGTGSWHADVRAMSTPQIVHLAALSSSNAHDAAAAIAHLLDPEIDDESTALPRAVGVIELLGIHGCEPVTLAAQIAARWLLNGADPAPCTPLGVAADGVVEIDLVADGPHALLAGTTGAGKSELLRTLVIGLATRLSPDEINFVLIDYKGGATFDACVDLPHVVGIVTDLDERLGSRALRSMEAELRRRERLLREAGATDLAAYRSLPGVVGGAASPTSALPRLVVVIDEFATLAMQQPDFIGALLGIAQRGRSLGVHLVLATQRPGGVISDDIRANTNLRIALRVQDAADSNDVIGAPGAAMLPRGLAGRAILRLANDEMITFQAARSTGAVNAGDHEHALLVRPTGEHQSVTSIDAETPTELAVLVDAIGRATRLNAIADPYRPWLPPLERMIAAGTIDGPAVGVIDDPDEQCRVPLIWKRSDGHLLIVGATGMGTTSAMLCLAAVVLRDEPATDVFVIDAMGDTRLNLLEAMPGCVAVVGLHERERLLRLLAAVDSERVARKSLSASAPSSAVVVMIDGLGALRAELETNDLFDQLAQLDMIVAEGQAVGISVVVTATQPGSVPSQLLSLLAQRWMFHLADPFDASLLGASPSLVTDAIPGRIVDVRTRREGQLALFEPGVLRVDPGGGELSRRSRPARSLRALPTKVERADLPPPSRRGDDVVLPIGLSYLTLEPSVLTLPGGEHVLIIGPYRSGRTTALHTVADAWREVHPQGWIGCVAPRRTSARLGYVFDDIHELIGAVPFGGDTLIVIDDAELVDDVNGTLSPLTTSRREGLTVAAAARPDALRSAYGHWTHTVRRSRLGVMMATCADLDGDLLNVLVPRRLPLAVRPGLAWIVANGELQLIQLAQATDRENDKAALATT